MVSRVVPAVALTMARSSPNNAFNRVDLPRLGAPMMATGMPSRMALPVRKESASEPTLLSRSPNSASN